MNASNDRQRRLVWDLPVRLFHGLIVVCFAGAWLTSESERHALLHETLGWTLAGLIVWRLVWGLVGTRHARFGDFVTGPGAVLRYLKNVARRTPEHHVGHNPASALAIVVLLMMGLVLGAMSAQLPDQTRKLLTIATENTTRLIAMINDLLDIEKIESGQMRFDNRPVDLVAATESSVQANSGFAEAHRVTLIRISPDSVIEEGPGHSGMSALIDLVARKPE